MYDAFTYNYYLLLCNKYIVYNMMYLLLSFIFYAYFLLKLIISMNSINDRTLSFFASRVRIHWL